MVAELGKAESVFYFFSAIILHVHQRICSWDRSSKGELTFDWQENLSQCVLRYSDTGCYIKGCFRYSHILHNDTLIIFLPFHQTSIFKKTGQPTLTHLENIYTVLANWQFRICTLLILVPYPVMESSRSTYVCVLYVLIYRCSPTFCHFFSTSNPLRHVGDVKHLVFFVCYTLAAALDKKWLKVNVMPIVKLVGGGGAA